MKESYCMRVIPIHQLRTKPLTASVVYKSSTGTHCMCPDSPDLSNSTVGLMRENYTSIVSILRELAFSLRLNALVKKAKVRMKSHFSKKMLYWRLGMGLKDRGEKESEPSRAKGWRRNKRMCMKRGRPHYPTSSQTSHAKIYRRRCFRNKAFEMDRLHP